MNIIHWQIAYTFVMNITNIVSPSQIRKWYLCVTQLGKLWRFSMTGRPQNFNFLSRAHKKLDRASIINVKNRDGHEEEALETTNSFGQRLRHFDLWTWRQWIGCGDGRGLPRDRWFVGLAWVRVGDARRAGCGKDLLNSTRLNLEYRTRKMSLGTIWLLRVAFECRSIQILIKLWS